MSPERLEGQYHAVEGDVFSLGLSLMELATGYPRVPMNRVKCVKPYIADSFALLATDTRKDHSLHIHMMGSSLDWCVWLCFDYAM